MSVDLYLQLGLAGYLPAQFKEEADILLLDINDRLIKTHGMVTVPFTFQDKVRSTNTNYGNRWNQRPPTYRLGRYN